MGAGSKVGGRARTSAQPWPVVPTLSPSLLSPNETAGFHMAEISNKEVRCRNMNTSAVERFLLLETHTHTGSF